MVVWETRADNPKRAVAPANFIDWRRETTAFAGLAAFDDFTATLTGSRRGAAHSRRLGIGQLLRRARRAGADRPRHDAGRRSRGCAEGRGADRRPLASAVRRRRRCDRQDDDPQRHAAHHRRCAAAIVRHADGRRWRSLDDGRSRHSAQLPVRGRSRRGARFAHHRRRRPAGAGIDARAGAGAADERDDVAVASAIRRPTPASAPASCRCTKRSSATCGRWSCCCRSPSRCCC